MFKNYLILMFINLASSYSRIKLQTNPQVNLTEYIKHIC